MSGSTLRFADDLQQKIARELAAIGDDPGKAALKGELLVLDSQVSMAKFEYERAMESGKDWEANNASNKIYALINDFDKLFRPPGMLDFQIDIGF